MPVVGKCLSQSILAHERETDRISQAEILIFILAQDAFGFGFQPGIGIHNLDALALVDVFKKC